MRAVPYVCLCVFIQNNIGAVDKDLLSVKFLNTPVVSATCRCE